MSQGNVETVRLIYEAWNEGRYEEFFAALDPEMEMVLPEGGVNESFVDFKVQAERFFETGDHVVAFVRMSGRGRQSGIGIEVRPAHVLTLRDGKVQRLEAFPHREKQAALEAVGLSK
jgi:ketosteroid isomerase-like protein